MRTLYVDFPLTPGQRYWVQMPDGRWLTGVAEAAQRSQERPNAPHPYPSDQTAVRSATGRQEGPG